VDERSTELRAFAAAARQCAVAMLSNASYIQGELLKLGIPAAHEKAIADVCLALVGTWHDVGTELDELWSAQPGQIDLRVQRIHRWLGGELPKLHAVVKALQAGSVDLPVLGTAYVLVAEAGADVLRSYRKVTASMPQARNDELAKNPPSASCNVTVEQIADQKRQSRENGGPLVPTPNGNVWREGMLSPEEAARVLIDCKRRRDEESAKLEAWAAIHLAKWKGWPREWPSN
jgi:hypothetical protein